MKRELQRCPADMEGIQTIPIFAGIELSYMSLSGDAFTVRHKKSDGIMVIIYCKSGKIGWKTESGNYVYLGAGDFSVHITELVEGSEISLPYGSCEGLAVWIDLRKFTNNPPDLLRGSGITGEALYNKLFKTDNVVSVAGNEQTDFIFKFFFNQPENMRLYYQKIKVLELLLYLHGTEELSKQRITEYQAGQIRVIRQIHDQLLNNLEKRITIDELSKQYLMNPTTVKALFKSVYGTSVAAHMKEHRMRKAAGLLLESEMSIAEIAASVGYDSQSKFSNAFRDFFQLLPKEYRKKR